MRVFWEIQEGKSMPCKLEICNSGWLDMDGTPSVWIQRGDHRTGIKGNFVFANIVYTRYIRLEMVKQKPGLERNLEEAL